MLNEIPSRFLTPLNDVAAVRRREQASFAQEGESFAMMSRAGETLYQHILRHHAKLTHLSIVVGGGNNGGDGWIVAGLAAQDGIEVTLYDASVAPRKGDAAKAEQLATRQALLKIKDIETLVDDHAAVVVDGLLGIGFKAPLSSVYESAILAMNNLRRAGAWVVSVDCPSGLDVYSGQASVCVAADLVVTFIADKLGHYLQDGAVACHEIVTENLQAVDLSEDPQAYFLNPAALDLIPPCRRTLNSHKGTYGHIAVLGGDIGFGGAAIMASEAAAKAGAGTVSLYTQTRHINASLSRNPNVMCASNEDFAVAKMLRGDGSVLVVGPGLGRSPWSKEQWLQCQSLSNPMVVDADGLYWLKQYPLASANLILTPHPGEAAFLLGCEVQEILQDIPQAALRIAKLMTAVVILKGATSVIAASDGRVIIVGEPCPGLAKGGSGDVLSGMVGACLAYYQDAFEAAVIAAAWHNKAAGKCGQHIGMVTMQPYQLLDYLE